VHEYLADTGIDVVFHRLSWTLTREAPGQLEFGPVYFFESNGGALEPLAPMLRSDDVDFSRIVRWVVYALVDAEMHGVSSANATDVDVLRRWPSAETAGALGLDAGWANRMVKQIGNYQQIFDRNLGLQSATQMERGPNRLWRDGGLLLTPLLR
jgi:general L-amino acid transport system substrate-binding protein